LLYPNIGNFVEFSSLLRAALQHPQMLQGGPAKSAIHLFGEIPNKFKRLAAQGGNPGLRSTGSCPTPV
jgi:hypothetical protein